MRAHRNFIAIAALLVALAAAPAALAKNSTLLSGYGGPGEGNQAILGSTVVGGHGGGRSGGGSSSGGGSTAAGSNASGSYSSPSIVAGREPSGATQAGHGARSQGGSGAGSSQAGASPRSAGAGTSQSRQQAHPSAAPASFYPTSERIPAGGQGDALGLSAADLAYILVGAGVLISLGVLTRRLGATGSRPGAS